MNYPYTDLLSGADEGVAGREASLAAMLCESRCPVGDDVSRRQ
jgi:hypothetical protein